jgi:hypothetical protein
MKVIGFKATWLVLATVALLAGTTSSPAAVLYSQPVVNTPPNNTPPPAEPSQVFTDNIQPYNQWSTKAFDDFKVPGPMNWFVTSVTVFGQEDPLSPTNPGLNSAVVLQFQRTALPSFNDTSDPTFLGTEDSAHNLQFNGLNVVLTPGTYWITAWVVRPEIPGGQWFWFNTTTTMGGIIGSEAYIQNPQGQLLFPGQGITMPVAIPQSQYYGPPQFDQAFTINGFLVPEPASVGLLGLGLSGIGWFGVRRRAHGRACPQPPN